MLKKILSLLGLGAVRSKKVAMSGPREYGSSKKAVAMSGPREYDKKNG